MARPTDVSVDINVANLSPCSCRHLPSATDPSTPRPIVEACMTPLAVWVWLMPALGHLDCYIDVRMTVFDGLNWEVGGWL